MSERPPPRILVKLGELQAQRPWWFVWFAILSLIPAAWAAKGLGFKADFSELLPDNKPSVIEMRRVSKRLAGVSTLSVVAQIGDTGNAKSLQKFVDALVPKLDALGPEWVGAVDHGVQDTRRFFEDNKLLFADLKDLEKAHEEILERYDYEVAKAQGTLIDEEDAPQPITAQTIKQRVAGKDKTKLDPSHQYPDGYYQSPDGSYIAVLIRTPVSGKAKTEEFRRKVEAVIAAVDPKRFNPTMQIAYTGDIVTGAEEYDAVVRDLSEVGAAGVLGVLLSVFLFFLRVRIVMTMGAVLIIGLLWSFGITRFTIGYLNSSSGFLVSIIAGNGINYAIMYMARYIEARRDQTLRWPMRSRSRIATRGSPRCRRPRPRRWPTARSRSPIFAASSTSASSALTRCGFAGSRPTLFAPALLAASERVWPSYRVRGPDSRKTPRPRLLRCAFRQAHDPRAAHAGADRRRHWGDHGGALRALPGARPDGIRHGERAQRAPRPKRGRRVVAEGRQGRRAARAGRHGDHDRHRRSGAACSRPS